MYKVPIIYKRMAQQKIEKITHFWLQITGKVALYLMYIFTTFNAGKNRWSLSMITYSTGSCLGSKIASITKMEDHVDSTK